MKYVRVMALSMLCWLLCACTADQVAKQSYDLSSSWKVPECQKKIDPAERERCLNASNMSYSEYKKLQEEARKP